MNDVSSKFLGIMIVAPDPECAAVSNRQASLGIGGYLADVIQARYLSRNGRTRRIASPQLSGPIIAPGKNSSVLLQRQRMTPACFDGDDIGQIRYSGRCGAAGVCPV